MIIKADQVSNYGSNVVVSLRCPGCRKLGVFLNTVVGDSLISSNHGSYIVGQRKCPNDQCFTHIFYIKDYESSETIASYPAERIDFDTTNVPSSVVNSLEEAITCHANQCYVAAAIMVRKTLEELCTVQGVAGNNLKQRIIALGTQVILPTELITGLHDLRLLGNDAAHIESQEYNQVGKDEVEIGIEVTKEVLKALYQYSALLDRLRSLKKT